MRTSSMITGWYYAMNEPHAEQIRPEAVIRVLNRAKIKFVLMGAHGISGWLEDSRATRDVDVLVLKSHHRKAMAALRLAYPGLTVQDLPAVTRFIDPVIDKAVIDLMKPVEDLYQTAFQYAVPVGKTHRVPTLEMALACKYAAMQSTKRDIEKRVQDEADFINMARHNYDCVELDILFSLGEMVKHGGGKEIVRFVEDAQAGRRLTW